MLLHIDIYTNVSTSIFNFIITLFIPLIGIYALKFNSKQLKYALIFFSSLFILSFIPYELGLLQSIKQGYNLESFGSDSSGLIGPFQSAHSASLTLASALVSLFFFWFEGSVNKKYLFLLFLLGSYFMLMTYVRTGLAMFLVGILPIFYYFMKKNSKYRINIIIISFFMFISTITFISSNPVLMNRITGERLTNSETDSLESLGSGRGRIYLASVLVFIESSPTEKIIGMGQIEQMDRIDNKIGMRIASHNGFLDLLLVNGLIGLFFILFLRNILNFSVKNDTKYKALVLSQLFLFLTMCFFQGYSWINTSLILMLALALVINQFNLILSNNMI